MRKNERMKSDLRKDLDGLFPKKENTADGDSQSCSSSDELAYGPNHGGCDFSVLTSKCTNKDEKKALKQQGGISSTPLAAEVEKLKPLLLGTRCNIPSKPPYKKKQLQPFSHLLVCDFEATCEGDAVGFPNEIIEFPVIVLDTRSLHVVAEFHSFVRPCKNPQLSEFCTELTGITQEMVDQSETLSEVLVRFDEWLNSVVYPLVRQWREYYSQDPTSALCATNLKSEQSRFIYDEKNVDFTEEEKMICFATDGPWDMRHFMHECSVLRDKVEFPPLFYRFINVRHSYCQLFKTRQVKLTHMLRRMGMTFEGQRHSGLADSRNITRVLAELIARGYRCHHVSTIKYYHRGDAYLLIDQATRELLEEYGDEDKPSNGRKNKPKAKKSKKSKRK